MAAALSAELVLELRQFLAGLRQAKAESKAFKDSSKSVESGWQSSLANIGGMVAKTAAAITASLTAAAIAAAAFVGSGLAKAMEAERLEIAFEVQTGSLEKARDLISDLRDMGAATPYEFADLASSANLLLTNGVAAENLVNILSRLGDIAQGDANKLASLALVTGQVANTGRLQGGDLMQFANAGWNPLRTMAQISGQSVNALREASSSGKIGFKELEEAIIAATSAGGQFFGMSDKQSAATGGLASTMADEFSSLQLALSKPLNDAVKPLFQSGIALLQQMAPIAESVGQKLADSLTGAVEIGRAVMDVFEGRGIEGSAQLFGATLRLGITEAVNLLFRGGTAAMAGMMAYQIEAVRTVVAMLSVLATADFWAGMGEALSAIAKGLLGLFIKMVSFLVTALKEATGPLGAKILGNADKRVAELGQTIMDDSAKDFGAAGKNFTPAADALGDRLSDAGKNIGAAAARAFDGATNLIDNSKDRAELASLGNEIGRAVSQLRSQKTEAKIAEEAKEERRGQPSGGGIPLINGSLSAAMNTISGRSAFTVLESQAAAQTAAAQESNVKQQKANDLLTKIEKNTEKSSIKPPASANSGAVFGD